MTVSSTGICSLELLNGEQRSRVHRLVEIAGITGVVTGVMLGSDVWDVRPLILEQGKNFLVRFLQPLDLPNHGFDSSYRDAISRVLSASYDRSHQQTQSTRDALVWITRPYEKEVLGNELNPFHTEGPAVSFLSVQHLLCTLRDIYSSGWTHGHLTLQNLALNEKTLRLLDIGAHQVPLRDGGVSEIVALKKILQLLRIEGISPSGLGQLLSDSKMAHEPFAEIERMVSIAGGGGGAVTPAPTAVAAPRGKLLPAVSEGSPISNQPVSSPRARSSSASKHQPLQKLRPKPWLVEWLGERRSRLIWLGIMAGFFGLALIAISRFSVEGKVGAGSMTMTIQDWDKADSEKRGNIVRRALQSPRGPELMLLKKIASEPDSKQFPQISLLRLGFDDRWFNETSDDDRRMIVLLALGELLPPEARAIPPLEGRHPGVQFALASSVSLDHSGDLFQRISLENLEKLPDPIGSCIKLMRQLGIRTLSEMAPRAYAHLVVGSITTKALEEYFSKVRDPALVRQLLGFLIPFLRADSPEAGYVEEYLNLRGSDFDDTYRWFNSEPIAQWSSAPAMIRLSLLVPHLPEAPITPEQLIDLLQFPDQTVRSHARDRLSGNIVPQRYKTLLLVLASDENKLTRSQAIFLLSALQVSDEEAFTFLSKWFRGEPDPDSVFLALLSQSRAQRSTPFDIEAARYLISRPWSASTAELAELARHPEPLARALAYSKLTMNTPEERAILQERFRSEDSESLKEQLRSKMNNP